MTALCLVAISAVMALPKEFHIDCSGWPDAAVVQIHFRFVPEKGKRIDTSIEMRPGATPQTLRRGIESILQDAGWRYRTVGKSIIVLEGSKDSPIQSVVFKSKDWKPDVRMTFLVPEK